MIPALILFLVTYLCLILFQKARPWIALGSALIYILCGYLPVKSALGNVDFNVLLMIAGTMGTVALVIESELPFLLSDLIVEKVPNVKWAIVILSLFAGVISAFIDNVATVLMIAPIALAMAKRLEISPVQMIIAIAVSSNLQGAATLVGDTTSILLGCYAGMSFNDFFVYHGNPGIFFAVEIGALVSAVILLVLFRKETTPVEAGTRTVVRDYVPGILLAATVLLLIAASLFPNRPALTNGIICMGIFLIGAVYTAVREKNPASFFRPWQEIDYETILLLFGLFLVIGGILFLIYSIITWASVLISAFIDNIPYVAAMLPVVQGIAAAMGADPTVLYFGLLCGATLGGNLTPIGASANITGIGILRKSGYPVKNSDFLKIGIPFTLAAIIPAYFYNWIFFGA